MFEFILKKFLEACKTALIVLAIGVLAVIAMYLGLKVQ